MPQMDLAPKGKRYKAQSAIDIFHRFITAEESGGEYRAYCPVCEEPGVSSSPSASFNFEKNVWNCQGKCGGGGSIYILAKKLSKERGFNIRSERIQGQNSRTGNPLKKYNTERTAEGDSCTEDNIKGWQRRLTNSTQFLQKLKEARGLTDDTIHQFEIGWDGTRYTLPVRDAEGTLVNVRRYKLQASGRESKMLNIPGRGEARIFHPEILAANDEVILAEGEMDMLIANQVGLPAITHTAGAATFRVDWGPLFSGKRVFVCYDNDEGGRNGAIKAGKIIAAHAATVHIVEIPIPVKGADLTDYLHNEGHTADDFRQLMATAQLLDPTRGHGAEEPPSVGKITTLEDSMAESNLDEPLEMTVSVAGKRNPPYNVPNVIHVECSMNKGPACLECPVYAFGGDMLHEIAKDNTDLFRFVDLNEEKMDRTMQRIVGARCTSHSRYTMQSKYTMEELTVSNSVDDCKAYEDQKPISRSVYSVSTHKTDVNTVVRLLGKNTTDPRQRMTFMAWEVDPVQTSLDSFALDKEMRSALYLFQHDRERDPDNYQTPLDKCFEIARDLSNNVTRIYGRDLMHVAYDLVWHSPLSFEVEGRLVEKGWLEAMVIGDTRTGKSETAQQLANHYQAGVVKSCEGATFAGLVGGVQQSGGGNHWMTTWGVIPLNDRRLVVLDEMSGLKDRDVIENMSSIRSSGRAQITKIANEETSARTRLLWITNPSDGMMLDERPDVGLGALRSLVKNQEDIARFDFVMAARASEVDPELINRAPDEFTDHLYTSELCSSLVLWAWSLKPEDIVFTPNAIRTARKLANGIGEEYVADPPLLQPENARFKLYRIATAIAARTFSIYWPKRGEMKLRVYEDHILDAKRFLDMIYSDGGMEYRSQSRRIIDARKRAKKMRQATKSYLLEFPDTVLATLRSVSYDSHFKGRDFEEFGGMSRELALKAVTNLQRMGMIHRRSQGYIVMDKQLVGILRELEEEDY